jgi:hypothetical protein
MFEFKISSTGSVSMHAPAVIWDRDTGFWILEFRI